VSAGTKTGWAEGTRKECRVPGCKPVTVSGQDLFGSPFTQNTFTLEISASGVRLRGLPPVARNQILLLEHGEKKARYRVVWTGETGTPTEGHIGLQLIEGEKSIFGMMSPIAGTFYDEYRRVEAELHRTRDRYKSLFENTLGLICTHDMNGVLLNVNPAAARALGYEPHVGAGMSIVEFLAPSAQSLFPAYLRRVQEQAHDSGYMLVVGRNGDTHTWLYRNLLVEENDSPPYVVGHATDVTEQKNAQRELQSTLNQLTEALAEVKTLRGLLPICAWCRRIRTETGQWTDLEVYVTENSEANFSHGVCPDCVSKLKAQPV
jgi:PAS domain S-box-containing protein